MYENYMINIFIIFQAKTKASRQVYFFILLFPLFFIENLKKKLNICWYPSCHAFSNY